MAIIEEDQHSALLAIAQSLLPGGTIDLPLLPKDKARSMQRTPG